MTEGNVKPSVQTSKSTLKMANVQKIDFSIIEIFFIFYLSF